MNRSRLFLAFSLAMCVSGLALPLSPEAASVKSDAIAKRSDARSVYLVEFAEPPLATFRGDERLAKSRLHGLAATSPAVTGAKQLDVRSPASVAYRAALSQLREDRLAFASREFGRSLEPLFVYDVVNNGVALELTADEAHRLAAQDGIANVEPEFVRTPLTDAGPPWIKATSMWNASGGGFRGEGKIVGVIDTGINALHSSFAPVSDGFSITNPRGSFLGLCATNPSRGCNNKLIGIFDLTTGSGDAEANDGSDKEGHGSHVASTAAGNPLTLSGGMKISGVAPRANVIMYKACEEEASCRGSWVLAAINQAVSDRVDVINYSIGGGAVDPWAYSDSMAMLAAFEAGTVVVVAAGNDGPAPGSLSSPSNSPWVISAANTTHHRAQVSRLMLSGGNTPRPGNSTLVGSSATTTAYGPAPIVYAGNYGSALCATGSNVNATAPDTSTSPWSTPVFTGQIVVCDRGTYARVIKGLNVKNAGGGGMALVNAPSDGASTVADAHELPATHLSYADGAALKQWLAEGSGHQAMISASATEYVAAFADVLNASSGRGPIEGEDWLKPNVAAPGTNIIAAFKDGAGMDSSFAYMTGTSMATPHIAGAALLLRQAHPDWTPSDVMSALQGTSRASVRMPDGVTPASPLDAGAGVVDLSKANKPGLVFPVTGAQFRAANPSNGGKPRELNLGSLVDGNCVDSCSFTRSVRNVSTDGEWTASVQMDNGSLVVNPSTFTLAAGASTNLQFTYTPSVEGGYSEWFSGRVILKRTGGSTSDIQIPVVIKPSAGNLPKVIELPTSGGNVASEAGWAHVGFGGLVALPSLRFSGSDLIEPLYQEPNIAQDPTRDEIYDNLSASQEGNSIFRLQATHTGKARLHVEAKSQTAGDIDLYVGNASTPTSMPSESTQLCSSHKPVPDEVCDLEVDVVAGQNFWILVQNWQSSTAGATDKVVVQAALLPSQPSAAPASQRPLIATGPGHTAKNEAFKARVSWNDPTMAPGDRRWGNLFIGGSDANPTGVGQVLVKMQRATTVQHAAAILTPDVDRSMDLLAGQAQDRLYLDVPPNASKLTVTSTGTGDVKLYLAHDAAPTTPSIGAAPARSAATATSTQAGANDTISVSGATLKPGRWYITPANEGSSRAHFTLHASLEYGSNRPQPAWGNWYNPARSGSGIDLFPVITDQVKVWTMTWYTYGEDGSPVWLLGTAQAPSATQSAVSFDVMRISWNGLRNHAQVVGNAVLSLTGTESMQMSWNIDGESGSQTMQRIGGQTCGVLAGTNTRPDGNWYNPAHSGFGFEVLAYPNLEVFISYVYDGQGIARWVIANREANPVIGSTTDMQARLAKGACPLCAYGASAYENVGTFSRNFSSGTRGHMALDVTFPAPMSGRWTSSDDVQLLTSPVICP